MNYNELLFKTENSVGLVCSTMRNHLCLLTCILCIIFGFRGMLVSIKACNTSFPATISIVIPGYEIPRWFNHQSAGTTVNSCHSFL